MYSIQNERYQAKINQSALTPGPDHFVVPAKRRGEESIPNPQIQPD
jgi:hypothetical protein